ncbi:MAG: GDSL-type esterase/lipase family protein [Bacteroidota bacterium]
MMKFLKNKLLGLITLSLLVFSLNAQDPTRFNAEIENLVNKEFILEPGRELLLFTGSSSVRMWNDIQDYFPGYNVINNGFGGSHFSDLIYFYNKLIIPHQPDYLFIYEGDNDIASGKKPGEIIKEAKFLLEKIRRDLPATNVVLITPKPSIARWDMRKNYEKLNRKLNRLAKRTDYVAFADVWTPMLDEKGYVLQDIFLEDKLHLNGKGYKIWGKVLSEFLK